MKKKWKLSKSWTTVTPFSKWLALSMFITFPIIAFYLGQMYQKGVSAGFCAHQPL